MSNSIRIISGLGNPEDKYERTLHNAGFWFVDALADKYGGSFRFEKKFDADVCKVTMHGQDVWLVKPQSYMNLSGGPIRGVLDYYRLKVSELLVAHDEIDLPPGTTKLKLGGGHGGHNGLRDTIQHCGAEFVRLRLGVGTGWNEVEYEALGENFHDRGVRSEEQIDLLRRLWKDEAISYEGRWHKVTDAGLNPLPVEKKIPIWLGGMAPQVIDRVARIADGWFPFATKELASNIQQMHERAKVAGRNVASIGIECIIPANTSVERLKALEDLGVSHVAVLTMNQELPDAQAHIDAIKQTRDTLASAF